MDSYRLFFLSGFSELLQKYGRPWMGAMLSHFLAEIPSVSELH